MSTKTDRVDKDVDGIRKLVQAIVKEQQKIDRHEGDVVACHIRIGARLAALRSLAKKTWGKQLKTLEISPRVASRYLKIARNWTDEIGLTESDLMTRLPTDLLKLEWLCRVPVSEMAGLLDTLNCKKATRSQVIAAVREILGEDPPTATDDVETFVQRLIHRLTGTVERLGDKFPEPEQQKRACELLAVGLLQVQDALQAGLPGDA